MKVLITGGAGFIGSSVSDKLLEAGNQVMIIDNYSTGLRSNNKSHHNLTIVEGSIVDEALIKKSFADFKPEVVLHTAASFKNPDDWEADIETNILGTVNVIKHCKLNHVKRLVYLQTSLCYGIKTKEANITLKYPYFNGGYEGGSSYAITKTAGEMFIELSKINFISFRLANVYGPRNLSGPLPSFFNHLIKQKQCTIVNTRRDFVFIDDVVDVLIKSINNQGKEKYYHISSGKDHSIKELFEITKRCLGITLKTNALEKEAGDDDVQTISLDSSQTEIDFEWKASTNFEEGIAKAITWYKANPVFETNTHLKNINKQ